LAGPDRADTIARLGAVVAAFTEDVGAAPTLVELLEILGLAVPTSSDHLEGFAPPVRFTAVLKGNKKHKGGATRVGELNDAAFVEASDLMAFLAEGRSAAASGPVSLAVLGEAVLDVLRWGAIRFDDVDIDAVSRLSVESAKRVAKAKIGDVVAIPIGGSRYRLAVVLSRDRYGTAYGLLEGTPTVPRLPDPARPPAPRGRPVHSDDVLVASGQWIVVGHDDALRSLFPADPEVYHDPKLVVPGFKLDRGPFGTAEMGGSGAVRKIDEAEAREVGLLDGTYQKVYLGEELTEALAKGAL
jgi:hypothetical protein